MAKKKVHFTIDKDSIIKGTAAGSGGYQYCTTTPVHPHAEKRSDRKKRYIYVHRVVMENHLGRFLFPFEEVHHKDENPSHNELSNLVMSDKRKHDRDHSKKNKFWKNSPRNKKVKKSSVLRVIASYLDR